MRLLDRIAADRPGRVIRDRDLQSSSGILLIVMLLVPPMLIMGAALGVLIFQGSLVSALLKSALLLGVPALAVVGSVVYAISERVGESAGGLYYPATRLASPIQDYSKEETLIQRGRTDEALEALRLAAGENPSDPRPPLRMAFLLRDEMDAPSEALEWLGRAASIEGLPEAEQKYLLREIMELCRSRLGGPELAMPLLAKVAQLRQGTGVGHWARQELREIKGETLQNDHPGDS
jgi:hypothetical protein